MCPGRRSPNQRFELVSSLAGRPLLKCAPGCQHHGNHASGKPLVGECGSCDCDDRQNIATKLPMADGVDQPTGRQREADRGADSKCGG